MDTSSTAENSEKKPPVLSSLQQLLIFEAPHPEGILVTFFLITPEDEVYFGQSFKNKKQITLAEYNAALEYVPDSVFYPGVPEDTPLTIAPDDLDNVSAFIKRPALNWYDSNFWKESPDIRTQVLHETPIMEQISKAPHPHIVRYFGCRVHRGRITCLFLERLDQTLMQYIHEPEFARLDKSKFVEALESAVAHIHSLGLAHNDINPYNIMVRDGMPVLVDFGSCGPFGSRTQTMGTDGWREATENGQMSPISDRKHDLYALQKLPGWLEKPE